MYTWKHYGGYDKHKTWGVYSPHGELLAVCVYRKGAIAMCKYLNNLVQEIKAKGSNDEQ